jgi:hypothetical protein
MRAIVVVDTEAPAHPHGRWFRRRINRLLPAFLECVGLSAGSPVSEVVTAAEDRLRDWGPKADDPSSAEGRSLHHESCTELSNGSPTTAGRPSATSTLQRGRRHRRTRLEGAPRASVCLTGLLHPRRDEGRVVVYVEQRTTQ